MTNQLSEMLEKVKKWPQWRQEDAVRMLEHMEQQGSEIYHLSDEERAAVKEGLAEIERGEIATDKEVAAVYAKYGL